MAGTGGAGGSGGGAQDAGGPRGGAAGVGGSGGSGTAGSGGSGTSGSGGTGGSAGTGGSGGVRDAGTDRPDAIVCPLEPPWYGDPCPSTGAQCFYYDGLVECTCVPNIGWSCIHY